MKERLIILMFLGFMLIMSTSIFAEDSSNDVATVAVSTNLAVTADYSGLSRPKIDSGFNVWRSVGAMMFILAGLMAVNVYLKKRFTPGLTADEGKRIKCLETMMIDHRRKIVLIEADGQRILVGVGVDRMDSLAVLGKEQSGKSISRMIKGQKTRGQNSKVRGQREEG